MFGRKNKPIAREVANALGLGRIEYCNDPKCTNCN